MSLHKEHQRIESQQKLIVIVVFDLIVVEKH